ncbi:MAG: PQQ-dependent sugar dehydrogenase [Candidatus Nitrosocaldus sp.]|nr:PQQ-dependent sugar dehydrogenase [Candidatus Nitrosocaldus sp.]
MNNPKSIKILVIYTAIVIFLCSIIVVVYEATAQNISESRFEFQIIASNLEDCGVTFEFLPDGSIICGGLKSGKVQLIKPGSGSPVELIRLDVYHSTKPSGQFDERGLIGLEVDPEFISNNYVYLHWTYWDEEDQTSYRQVSRFTLRDDRLTDMQVLLDRLPASWQHNGGPLEFGPDGKLYVTGGDAAEFRRRSLAQDTDSLAGKILRINKDGSIPEDNPFPGSPIYTLGHRNVFGIAFHPITGRAYVLDNGPETGDKLSILYPGNDYGWPTLLGGGGIYSWEGAIAPTEMIFYTGSKYAGFENDLLLLSYNLRSLLHIELEGPNYDVVKSIKEYRLPSRGIGSVTDIEQGPDGYIYVSDFKTIWRLVQVEATLEDTIKGVRVQLSFTQPKDTHPASFAIRFIDQDGQVIKDVSYELLIIRDNSIIFSEVGKTVDGTGLHSYRLEEGSVTLQIRGIGLPDFDPQLDAISFNVHVIPEFPQFTLAFMLAFIMITIVVLGRTTPIKRFNLTA